MRARKSLLAAVALAAAAFGACSRDSLSPDAKRGRQLMISFGCVACHAVEGLASVQGRVGPPLSQFRQRTYIGGVLPNTPKNLQRWIIRPARFSPNTAMPNLGVSADDAADMAAYLYAG